MMLEKKTGLLLEILDRVPLPFEVSSLRLKSILVRFFPGFVSFLSLDLLLEIFSIEGLFFDRSLLVCLFACLDTTEPLNLVTEPFFVMDSP